ncbi:bacterio-opsin activator domain-containing protein [Halorussus halophilus]|uniref:bacterio-opsin activator domain-containing protein n=1 Tax=Halorussus halophilus TaxID=2650975 RepID=UPI001300E45C|nr:bacterio-opsin activator domain-containing protein [Halorussus halophilus]
MSVIVEFSIESDEFTLGRALAEPPGMDIEFERIVPLADSVVPFVWVSGGDFEVFENHAVNNPSIQEIVAVDRVRDHTLYRIEWVGEDDDLIQYLADAGATILEGYGNNGWEFRLRFPNHEMLSEFYNTCTENEISIHIDRTYTLTEKTEYGRTFDLSQEQREALVAALQQGYLSTPKETNLEALAEQFEVSQQAMSNRIRRGTEQVLRAVLVTSASDLG